jgi:hypothetical protein
MTHSLVFPLFVAMPLRNLLGMKPEPSKAPVGVLVIGHAEMPTDNEPDR